MSFPHAKSIKRPVARESDQSLIANCDPPDVAQSMKITHAGTVHAVENGHQVMNDTDLATEWRDQLIDEIRKDSTLADIRDAEARQRSSIVFRGNIKEVKGYLFAARGTNLNGRVEQQGRTYVGRYCAFGSEFTTINGNHRTDTVNMNIRLQKQLGFKTNHIRGQPNYVGHNVWAGTGVTLLNGAVVGSGSVLAAGSVITKDVLPFSIVGGTPAKFIKFRFTQSVIEQLLAISWWNWTVDRMSQNADFFNASIGPDADINLMKLVKD